MKIRTHFVSNSSSASFCIPHKLLDNEQITKLVEYCSDPEQNWDNWSITGQSGDFIHGFTIMDNGDIYDFFREIGVDTLYIQEDH